MSDLLIDTTERVMTLTFNRVDKKNAFTTAMYARGTRRFSARATTSLIF